MVAQSQTLKLRRRWLRLGLLGQFAVMGTLVLLLGMASIGYWVSEQIRAGVMRNSAASTALFMRSFIEPVVQELATGDRVSGATEQLLDQLLTGTDLGTRVASFKIWKEGGLIAYSSRKEIIGKRFPLTENLKKAWQGEVTAEFDSLEDAEDALERASGVPLLEIYSPVRDQHTGRIIAVAEFYERATQLHDHLDRSTRTSWMMVGGITLLMFSALTGIVMRGSRTIEAQQRALRRQVSKLSALLEENRQLSTRLRAASQRTAELNERYLRRISAELHDGPAQLMAFALLRLDSLLRDLPPPAAEIGQAVRDAVSEALADVRAICRGLSLPELANLSPEKLIRSCVEAHERRTHTQVTLELGTLPDELPHPLKICLYRFVQEGLNNAWRHADGQGQQVRAGLRGRALQAEVIDSGPGMATNGENAAGHEHGLGLAGLRERAQSFGGQLDVESRPDGGTRLRLTLPLDAHSTGVSR